MLSRILLGLVVMIVGFLMVWKTMVIQGWFGYNSWAEQHLGPGGTYLFYKLLGVLVAFLGMLIVTGLISRVLEGTVAIFIPA